MMVKTYLKNHPEIKEVWLQAKNKTGGPDSFCKCNVNNFDDMNHFGNWKIKGIEKPPEPGELVTLFV